MVALDRKVEQLESKVQALQAENLKLQAKVNPLQREIDRLKGEAQQSTASARGNPKGYSCDHCGSQQLQRIGNRPNKTFGAMGVKDAVFRCIECGKESAFIQD